jgi:hypothetical protein
MAKASSTAIWPCQRNHVASVDLISRLVILIVRSGGDRNATWTMDGGIRGLLFQCDASQYCF